MHLPNNIWVSDYDIKCQSLILKIGDLKGNQRFYRKIFFGFLLLGIACRTNIGPFGAQICKTKCRGRVFKSNWITGNGSVLWWVVHIFKLRSGASVPRSLSLSFCLSVCRSVTIFCIRVEYFPRCHNFLHNV